MPYELTAFQMVLLSAGVVGGHAALFFAARWINPLYILAAVVLTLAPFSGSAEIEAGMLLKWTRGYALALLVLIGIFKYQRGSLGAASQVWIGFAALYVLSGAWSLAPPLALWDKGQFGLVVLSGFLLVTSVRSQQELIGGLRFLSVAAGVTGLFMFTYFALNPEASLVWGRANILGASATRIAMTLGALLLICTYLALNERSTFWKAVAFSSCGALTMVVILTGTRGSTAAVLLGFLIQVVPQSGRRIRTLMLPVLAACVALIAIETVGGDVKVERFLSTENTRSRIWGIALDLLQEKPLIGHGWTYHEGMSRAAGMHSIYLQVAVEMGLLGAAAFGVCLVFLAQRGLQSYRFVRRQRILSNLGILPLSLVAAVLFDGLISTAPLDPSSFAMMMALGIGLIDRLPQLAILEKRRALRTVAYGNALRRFRRAGGLGSPEAAK